MIYLNNAATTWPKPAEVIELAQKVLSEPIFEHGRTTSRDTLDYVEAARETVARFLSSGDPNNIIFTANATDSLNMLIHGWAKRHPDPFHVITTDLEHNSVLRPLRTLEREGRCTISLVQSEGSHVTADQIRREITDETRLAVLGHGSNVLGSVQDIGAIGRELRERGIYFIVDGAQTAGQYPIDLLRTPLDAFAFTGHKYLFGLPGTGGFFVRDPDAIAAVKQGGTGVDSKALYQSEDLPLKFEAGTPNYLGIAGLYAGVRYISRIGLDEVIGRTERMTRYLLSELASIERITVFNRTPELPVVTFNIEGMDNEDVGVILMRAYQIVARTGLHCAPLVHKRFDGGAGGVRLSLSYHTTMNECLAAADAIREIAETIGP